MRNIITGRQFIDKMVGAGILPSDKPIRRVQIDADMEGVVTIYLEFIGDELLLELPEKLDEAKPILADEPF